MDYYLISTLLVLVSSLLIPAADSANSSAPLYTICSNNYTKNSTNDTFAESLNNVFLDLQTYAPETGFRNSSCGQDSKEAFGLSLCRGDILNKGCADCLKEAVSQIKQSCPSSLEAITWYDNCTLKYSDDNFFGKIDYNHTVWLWNLNNAGDSKKFYITTKGLLNDLSQKASAPENKLIMFASGSKILNENTTIYGMAQCTRDLALDSCKNCLDTAVERLRGSEQSFPVGGRTLMQSCFVRYETYVFLNNQTKY